MKNELWCDIIGYEGYYQISSLGRIKSFKRPTSVIRATALSKIGYSNVVLLKEKKTKTFLVHRLVANAFIPNAENKKEVNHINGIRSDNRV